MNAMQKYPHIIELSACILNMFVMMFLFPINLLISLGMCYLPKLSKYINSLFFTYKGIQCVSTYAYSPRFTTHVRFFIVLGKLSLLYTPLNLDSFS